MSRRRTSHYGFAALRPCIRRSRIVDWEQSFILLLLLVFIVLVSSVVVELSVVW
jgi:hypothetical protein